MRRLHSALAAASLATVFATPLLTTLVAADDDWTDDWTVLTMAPNGSWGAATSFQFNKAIAAAIANCKMEYQREIGCGAVLASIRSGWSLGIRCGRENIVVTGKTLADAKQAASRREVELREYYVPNMPPCRLMVAVDPKGAIIVPHSVESATKELGGADKWNSSSVIRPSLSKP